MYDRPRSLCNDPERYGQSRYAPNQNKTPQNVSLECVQFLEDTVLSEQRQQSAEHEPRYRIGSCWWFYG